MYIKKLNCMQLKAFIKRFKKQDVGYLLCLNAEVSKILITILKQFVSNVIFLKHKTIYIFKPCTSTMIIIVILYNRSCINDSFM